MALFGKKKNDQTERPACGCQCSGEAACAAEPQHESGLHIQVLGSGCASCHALLENTREAVKTLGLDADVAYVTDMPQIMAYGVMRLPALAINGKVVSMGKVLKAAEIAGLLAPQAR